MTMSYVPGLDPSVLLSETRRMLGIEQRAEWLVCRYLADLADEKRFRAFGWFSDIYHFARLKLALGARRTRERVRIGRALRDLPEIEEAFAERRVSFARVREITRVATATTEHVLIDLEGRPRRIPKARRSALLELAQRSVQ